MRTMTKSETKKHLRLAEHLAQFVDYEVRIDAAMVAIESDARDRGISPDLISYYRAELARAVRSIRSQAINRPS